VITRAVNVS